MAETSTAHEDHHGVAAVRLAIPVGVGLVIGVFASLGIEGDTLTRLLRNDSSAVALPLILVVVAISLSAFIVAVMKGEGTWGWKRIVLTALVSIFAGLLLVGMCLSIWVGIKGLAERENPAVGITVNESDGGRSITVNAKAPTLRSNEKMLVKIAAVMEPTLDPYSACAYSDPVSDSHQRLMLWQETGPTRSGEASVDVTATIPEEAVSVCVLAALVDRDTSRPEDDRRVITIVDATAL